MFEEEETNFRTMRVANDDDIDLLIALASMFYLYRKFEKSLSILAVAEHLAPDSRSVMELKAVVLCELHKYDTLLDVIDVLEEDSTPLAVEIIAIKRRALRSNV